MEFVLQQIAYLSGIKTMAQTHQHSRWLKTQAYSEEAAKLFFLHS